MVGQVQVMDVSKKNEYCSYSFSKSCISEPSCPLAPVTSILDIEIGFKVKIVGVLKGRLSGVFL